MYSLLTLALTLLLIVAAGPSVGPTAFPQTAVPETPTPAVGGMNPTNPITMTTGLTGTQPITRTPISPIARVAMSVTVGISRSIQISTPAFQNNGAVPKQYTCDGDNTNPPLSWTGVPVGAKSLAMTLEDPDAPGGLFVHWVVFNMPPDLTGLKEAMPTDAKLADGTIQALNGSGKPGYIGPCPPSGVHRYFFRVYALDTVLDLLPTANRNDLFKAVEGHVIGWGQLNSHYQRGG
jgi:Raf kinase inhibitor-like YbhB/YbcL family protein